MAAIRELYLISLFLLFSQISGQWSGNATIKQCGSSDLTITFNFSLGGEGFLERYWYLDSTAKKIAVLNSTGFLTVEPPYISRLTLSGTSGITLANANRSDSGSYLFVFFTDTTFTFLTAITTVIINEKPNKLCKPITTNYINSITCKIPAACPVKDSIQARWNDGSIEELKCPSAITKSTCCAIGDPVTNCYNESLCTDDECKGTTTTTNITVTSSSLSSTTSSATTYNTSTTPTTNGPSVSTTSSTFTSISPTTVLPCNDTNNTSTSRSPTGSNVSATSNISASTSSTAVSPANNTSNASTSTNPTKAEPTAITKTSTGNNGIKNKISDTDVKVIVPAVVVPCGLLIIGAIVLVVFCVRRKARKNVRESPDGMAIQDKGNNIEGWKQSLGHGKATDNLDTVYTTPDGFIIYPGPAAESTARSYKNKKYHGVTDQYSRPNPGTHHHQADYIPSTYTSARAYTHRGKKHHVVTDQYSRPYPDTYGYQTVYFPSTYMSARTYAQKGKTYEGHQPASNLMANSRLAYDQTAYYPQTGYYGQSGQDVYYSGGGQHSYGQRSRSHHDYNGRKQQRDYYNQYEMADYGGNRTGYRQTKQDTAFYY